MFLWAAAAQATPPIEADPDAIPERPATLRAQFGIEYYRGLLDSPQASQRTLAHERLSALGSPRALQYLDDALLKLLARGGNDDEARHIVVLLADHTDVPHTQSTLLRVLMGASGTRRADVSLPLRALAALALAADGNAQGALIRALRSDADSARLASEALLAHPPRTLQGLTEQGNPAIAKLLGELGDQRAFSALREWVRTGSSELQEAALWALCQLGDYEVVEVARHWLATAPSAARREVAARVLAASAHPEADEAIASLLQRPSGRPVALALSEHYPLAAPVNELMAIGHSAEPDDLLRVMHLLGRSEREQAAEWLAERLADSRHGELAAEALALSSAPNAPTLLRTAAEQSTTRRDALLALVIRQVQDPAQEAPPRRTLQQLFAAKTPLDRAVGAFGLAALDPARALTLLRSEDVLVVMAASRTALLQDEAFFQAAADRLAATPNALLQQTLCFALLDADAAARVPDPTLLALVTRDAPGAALAALALARRDAPLLRTTLFELLASKDGALRAHATLGLGQSPQADASGLLVRQYEDEDARVRWAAVAALSAHPGPLSHRTLQRAARLDPDPRVQGAARLALAGIPIAAGGARGRPGQLGRALASLAPGWGEGATRISLNPALALEFPALPAAAAVDEKVAVTPELTESAPRSASEAGEPDHE